MSWDAFSAQALFTLVIFWAIWVFAGMIVMKYFVRQVPILNHAAILFWASFRVQIVVLALMFLGRIFGVSQQVLSGILSVLALCAVGWLVTQHLARNYGVPTKFPAVGAKVMTTMFAITWLIVIAMILATGA